MSEKLEIALSNADSSLRNGELIYGARIGYNGQERI